MKIAFFYQSLVSDWNHGNAHFLRGVTTELLSRGHRVTVFEPKASWSAANLVKDHGSAPIDSFHRAYPGLSSVRYDPDSLDLDRELDGVDLVLVHEWNTPELVNRIGAHRRGGGTYRLLFHDTHHRAVSDPGALGGFDLSCYDGVLAFGESLRARYLDRGWHDRVWTWHEAADIRHFRPFPGRERQGDLVWIGNWGDGERSAEIDEYLLEPVKELGLRARIHGVRYPRRALDAIAAAGIEFAGWLPNFLVPEAFSHFAMTVHIPRRQYVTELPGIPTIRVFEACACGIPLVSAFWDDREGLFTPGSDFLVARNGREMTGHLAALAADRSLRRTLALHARETVLRRHTCGHRVDELLSILGELGPAHADAAFDASIGEEACGRN